MRAVIYIRSMETMDRQQRREKGIQWLYEAMAASGHPEITAQTCPIHRTEKGKPYFADRPEIHFSISHSKELWACAVADGPVGLDLQYHKSGRLDNIPGRFFHARESAWLERQGFGSQKTLVEGKMEQAHCPKKDDGDRKAFFDVWTAKESYVKWTGEGIDRHFRDVCVVDNNGLAEYSGGAYFWRGHAAEHYSLCLCGGEAWEDVQIRKTGDGDQQVSV